MLSPAQIQEILRLANIIYFRSAAYERASWAGVKTAKCPMDMWVYQEMLHELKPDFLIETGTLDGGSALFFAHMFDLIGHGTVITVDKNRRSGLPDHSRLQYLFGSSTDPEILAQIRNTVREARKVMVILDSDHKSDYKLSEMQLYAEFVTPESYMIAEDSCFDEYPAWPEFGPGPADAIRRFIESTNEFEIDRSKELHMITFVPKGFLKRKP